MAVAGEVVVEVLTDFPQRFDSLETVYLGDADQADAYQVSGCRWHKDRVLLSIEGFSDRNAVERLRDQLVQLPIEEAMPLAEDEYYAHQLIGLDVLTVDGQDLGELAMYCIPRPTMSSWYLVPRGRYCCRLSPMWSKVWIWKKDL